MRFIGAVSLLGVAAVHLQQDLGANVRTVPTIGSLFLLNAIGCAVVGFTLLMPIERALSARRSHFAVAALAIGFESRPRYRRSPAGCWLLRLQHGCDVRRQDTASPRLRLETVAGWWRERYERLVYASHRRALTLEIHTYYPRRQVLPLFGSRLILEITSRGSRLR
jgi:hypothetical protein